MSSQRGEYRGIRRVLLDGPDFQRLSERARFVFVVAKLNAGPVGIETEYEAAAVEKFASQTGMSSRAVRKSLKELEDAHWIERELNVLWLCGHLEHEPSYNVSDAKHRAAVQKYVASLPRLSIVARFVGANPEWFPISEARAHGLGWACEGAPQGPAEGLPSTEEGDRRLNDDTEDGGPSQPAPSNAVGGAAIEELRNRLVSDHDRASLDELLSSVRRPSAWVAEIAASIDNMSGHQHVTPVQAGQAIRDYVAKVDLTDASLKHFRSFLRTAARSETRGVRDSSVPANGPGERAYQKTKAALEVVR